MAHELEIVGGQAQMAYAGEKPWHGLGVEVDGDTSPMDMMAAAGLDWLVEKTPNYIHRKDTKTGEVVSIPNGTYSLVRDIDNSVLTPSISERWNPTQNHQAFEFFNQFCGEGGAKMETAGSLFGGQIVWGMARLGSSFTINGDDKTNGYLLFSLPHKLGSSIQVRTTSVRVVCNNTLSYSLSKASDSEYRQSHVGDFNFEHAQEVVQMANDTIEAQGEWAESLTKKKFTELGAIEFFNELVGDPMFMGTKESDDAAVEYLSTARGENSKLGKIMESYYHAPGASVGNGWGIINAVTHYSDHVAGRDANARLSSSWYGSGNTMKEKAQRMLEKV